MRIGAIREGSYGSAGGMPRDTAPAVAADTAPTSRALVVVEPPAPRERPAPHRQAPFLAQLIATKAQHPQTRARRRAEPAEAIAAYRAVAARINFSS
jgi:hypothetical protein